MELLQIQYFLALAQEEHVSNTAEMLMISQPTLSLTIKKLEEELGVQLFDRTGRRIRLNENGRLFMTYAQNAMDTLEKGKEALSRSSDKYARKLSLGIESPLVWQDLTCSFATKYFSYEISQKSIEDNSYVPQILDRSLDFYIGSIDGNPAMRNSDKFEIKEFAKGRICVIVPEDSEIAKKGTITFAELKDEMFICRPPEHECQQYTNSLCMKAGFVPKVSMVCDYTTREVMVANGQGITFSSSLATRWLNVKGVKPVFLSDENAVRHQHIIWLKDRPMTPAMKDFLNYAIDFTKNLKF